MLLQPGAQNFTCNFKILNVFWTGFVSKEKTEQFNSFNCFQILKIQLVQMALNLCEI